MNLKLQLELYIFQDIFVISVATIEKTQVLFLSNKNIKKIVMNLKLQPKL